MSDEAAADKIKRLREQLPRLYSLREQLEQLFKQGRYEAAIDTATNLCKLEKEVSGSDSADYATSLHNLAWLYDEMGNYPVAEPLYRQALEIKRTAFGEQHPSYAASTDNLAELYHDKGNYQAAEPLYRQALEIYRATLGEQHPDYATTLGNLAELYHDIGNYPAAEPLYRQAREIYRATLGEQHPHYATSLDNLAGLYYAMGNYPTAEPLYRQALEIKRAALGEQHPSYALSLNNLALLYDEMGNYSAAEPLSRQALDIRRETLGEQHPFYAASLNNLAALYSHMGNYRAAEPLFREALEIYRTALGERHPDYAGSLNNLAALLAATDRAVEAFDTATRAASIYDHMIAQIFSIGSERQRMAYLQSIQSSVDVLLSLINQRCPQSDGAARSAMDLVLRRKAIGAEALAAQRDAVLGGKYPDLHERLTQLRTLTSQIAQTMLTGPGTDGIDAHRQRLSEWNAKRERLEAELARQIPEMNIEQTLSAADHLAVARPLPEETTLVEFVRFRVFDFAAVPAKGEPRWQPPRYLAFVLRAREPGNLSMIDLGEAEAIDRMIAAFRKYATGENDARRASAISDETDNEDALANSARTDLRAAVFDPLIPHLSGSTRLLLAPDGELTRLPFEALPTDDGGYVIDAYHLSYLSVGRDVLRFGFGTVHEPTASVVIADPDFDLGSEILPVSDNRKGLLTRLGFGKRRTATSAPPGLRDAPPVGTTQPATILLVGRHSRDFARAIQEVPRLPGAKDEGEKIADLLKANRRFEQQALEGPIKSTRSPRILHFATHGFFLENQQPDRVSPHVGFSDFLLDRLATAGIENPLLRSGLVLAGVNTWLKGGHPPEEAEDGILTAADVSGLDLTDTDLVVLSACETGLGDIQVGEGVFGLRRAFVLAGAKTLIMSLWKVPDEPTKELMIDFYTRILRGEPRAEALRNAQLAIKDKYPHPYFWGAFICQGDPGPLP